MVQTARTHLATRVYLQYLASRGVSKRFWFVARKMLVKLLNDPTCSLLIHGVRLSLPLSHALPDYLERFPFYDRLPQRISEYIRKKREKLICIDIGANIGDTVAAFYSVEGGEERFLAVEPNPRFGQFFTANWAWNKNVTMVSVVCSSGSSDDEFVIEEKNGTASIFPTKKGMKISRKTVDELSDDFPFAKEANIIKIDTDGHDFEVIAGAEKLLLAHLPIVLFECGVFANVNYVEDCIRTLDLLKRCGYKNFLLYNNFGHLLGKYSLSDLSSFKELLFFQLTSDFYYFDLLVLKDQDFLHFYKTEVEYFIDKMQNKSLSATAMAAVDLASGAANKLD